MLIRGIRLPVRWRTACAVLAVACVAPATLALAATPASAYVRINEHCILRAYEPLPFGSGTFLYAGAVDCRGQGEYWTEVEVCAEVQNTVSGDWYKITGSCRIDGPHYLEYNEEAGEHAGICGVNYRTWDRGEVWHGGRSKQEGSWGSATYRSSAVKDAC